MSTIAEIQDAIEKLPSNEQRALSEWLSARGDNDFSCAEGKLKDMAADEQVQAELRAINLEFATADADGLAKL